ncbi:hypothetical protein CPLU01_15636 [Colletotrichum plurivorum]|uniref:Aminoglycoside phosphotransferase domain-containing protein n=1 Tax=Colletotrichum plurivorum TaxID=2175906 RepID=A0A8H6J8Z1_9PEZI|nr:hypothetical protein CPLU01_15636 [Colletotrichum plurivorum]
MTSRDIIPDKFLLSNIFPDQPQVSISIILQNWQKCVFKASFPNSPEPCCPKIVRLEVTSDEETAKQFAIVSAMQKIAADVIHNLVPRTFQTGVANNEQGKQLQFCVMEFVEGYTLEEAWEQMSGESRHSVVAALIEALQKLHCVRISDERVQALMQRALKGSERESFKEAVMGGPSTGLLGDGLALLEARFKRLALKKPFYDMTHATGSDDIVIKSHYEDIGSKRLQKSIMEQWAHEAVLCHNDLTPRNIIVRPRSSPDGGSEYQLAAIIDWELAGFYPASYELSLQDTYLSGANRLVSFYLLLKEGMMGLVPACPSQMSLLQAMEIMFESRQKRLLEGSNIPAHIRQRFLQRLRLRRDEDPYVGWVPAVFTRADAQALEDEVVAEMVATRHAKAAQAHRPSSLLLSVAVVAVVVAAVCHCCWY